MMGLFPSLFKSTPESEEIRSRKPVIKKINARGGAQKVFEMFEESFREVRDLAGYAGHLIENEHISKPSAKTCALMVLSDIKRDQFVTGKPTADQIAKIRQHPMFDRAKAMFLMSDEIVTVAEHQSFQQEIEDFVRSELARMIVNPKTIHDHQSRNPILRHIAGLKEQSAAAWDRWTTSETKFPVI